jgi:hypothetical protein
MYNLQFRSFGDSKLKMCKGISEGHSRFGEITLISTVNDYSG